MNGVEKQDDSGSCVSMNTSTETIPRKTKGHKRGGGNPAASSGGATHSGDAGAKGGGCALCKKYNTRSPNAWKTHPTNDCKKYNKDGTTKPYERFGSGDGNTHTGKKSNFVTMKREAKSVERKLKKMKKQLKDVKKHHNKSKKEYYSSSSSSSSDSDSE